METVSHIESLDRRFGIAGIAQVVSGRGGFPTVRITSPAAAAEVSLYGAQVLSWRPAGREEVLFVSEQSRWKVGHAIRGGIPVCFPWFREKAGDPKAPKHGFVRTREWGLDSLHVEEDGTVTLVCITSSDDTTRALWRHEFLVALRLRIGASLCLELTVINGGATPLRFEEALHTYFRVGDVRQASVHGLNDVTYLDNTDGNKARRQEGILNVGGPTDSAYMDTQSPAEILDPVLKRRLRTEKLHSLNTIVWNPWQSGAAAMADLGDGEWQQMLCVEASNIQGAAVSLAPGEEHMLRAILSVCPE
ncbi:MAG TPA: D-hexose-6-phosphate mutarotase [Terracidiphilus sp.]